jgi:hypothetical protein
VAILLCIRSSLPVLLLLQVKRKLWCCIILCEENIKKDLRAAVPYPSNENIFETAELC